MNPKEQFYSIQPKHLVLQQHIAYYYFHQTFSDDFRRVFTYYPNYRMALNVFQHSDIHWNSNRRFTIPNPSTPHNSILTYSTQFRREVVMRGRINKIGIIFEPLGFNHFIDLPLQQVLKDTINSFDYYGAAFQLATQQVFESDNLEQKRDMLDAFFIQYYRPFPIEEILFSIQQILDAGGAIALSDLACQYNLSRKTLLRLFNKHLALHFRGFSNLVKFRKTLQLKKQYGTQLTLTQLAYESQFCDQSALIKNIKAFTGLTPKQLFYKGKDIGGKHTLWTATS